MIRFPIVQGGFLQRKTVTYNKGKQQVDEAEIRLCEDADGFRHWTCECDVYRRTKWCNHIWWAYGANDKTPLGVERVDPYELFIDTSPAVVVFSKDAVLLVPILVLPVDSAGETSKTLGEVLALWGNPKREGPTNFSYEGSESIGFVEIFREGRGSLRRLILEWLAIVPVLYPKEMTCRSTFHEQGEAWTEVVSVEDFYHYADPSKIVATPKGGFSQEVVKKHFFREVYNLLDKNICCACDEAGHIEMDPF